MALSPQQLQSYHPQQQKDWKMQQRAPRISVYEQAAFQNLNTQENRQYRVLQTLMTSGTDDHELLEQKAGEKYSSLGCIQEVFKLGLYRIDTGMPDCPLMLQNCFIEFDVEHQFGWHATEPDFAGDIGAMEISLIYWLTIPEDQSPSSHFGADLLRSQIKPQSINQSNFYSANIPGEARLSGVTAESVFNSKIKETVP